MAGFVIIFQRFSTTLRRFPKIFPNSSEGHANVAEHFLKMSEDYSEEDPKMFRSYTNEFKYNLRDKPDISEIIDISSGQDMENTPLESRM